MQYKQYGQTGKQISVVGFGGMRFKEEDYKNGFEKCAEIVRYASSCGINYFDTAPYYCNDKSEEIFGEAFKNMPNPYYVSTKSGISSEKTADDVRRRVEKSLKRLGVEKIDFFNMWCILDLKQYEKVMAKGGPYEGAMKLKDEGLVEHIVFSTHATGDEIAYMVNQGGFDGVTLGYNATNFAYRRKGIEAAYEKGLGVVTMNPLGGGIIPQNPDFYSFIKDDEKDSLAVSALKFNISHKEITVALAGMGSIDEVKENILACENVTPMTNEKLEGMTKHLSESLNTLCTGCGYCTDCPKDIAIPKLMDAYNMLLVHKKEEAVTERLKDFWGMSKEDAKACIACGICEKKCTQHLPIIERLKEIANMKAAK